MKRIISAILILSMVIAIMPNLAALAESTTKYYSEWGIYFDASTGTITDCDNSVANLVLPNSIDGISVTTIGPSAFDGCKGITNLIIPNSVTSIGRFAFQNCDGLTEMTIPKSVTTSLSNGNSRGQWFDGCDNLRTVTFEDGTETILKAINGSPALETINIPNSVKVIHEEAFSGCNNLKNIKIPPLVTTIEYGTFDGCRSLTSFTIPDNITAIGRFAFQNCDGLTEMTIPKSVTTSLSNGISRGQWFDGCDNLKTVTFEDGTKTILVSVNYSKVETVNIPDSVTYIEAEAFSGCNNLKNIKIPPLVTTIEYGTFDGCRSLTSFTIPDNITAIGRFAFQNCDGLTEMTIPKSVTTSLSHNYGRGQWFDGCDNLKTVTFEDGTKTILESVNHSKIETVNIPDSVTYIEAEAFSGCNNLKNIKIPPLVTTIEYGTFDGCRSLTSFTIPDNITAIGRFAFQNCDGLTEMTIPKSVTTSLPNGYSRGQWFSGCDNLTAVIFEEGTKTIFDSSLRDVKNLEIIHVPDSVATVEKDAFTNCNKAVVYGAEKSAGITAAIDNNKQFVITKEIADYDYFEYSSTDFYTTIDTILGYLPFNFEYKVKPGKDLTEMKMVTKIPSGTSLMEKTVKYNDKVIFDYEYDETTSILTIPLTENEGKVSFSIKPSNYDMLPIYAKVDFVENEVKGSEIIGVINCSVPSLTIAVPEKTNSAAITINGRTNPSTNVDLYVGQSLVGSTTSLKTGSYSFDVTLPDVQNYQSYDITAKATTSKGEESISAAVQYDDTNPEIKSIFIEYEDHDTSYSYDLTKKETPPTIVYNPKIGYTFKVTFEDNDAVDNVTIVSSKRNLEKTLKAEWDESEQAFVTKGNFGSSIDSYVPGTIYVEYTRKRQELDFLNGVETKQFTQYMDDRLENSTVQIIDQTETTTHEVISLDTELQDLLCDEIHHVTETIKTEYTNEYINDLMSEVDNINSYFFDKDGEKYILNLDKTDPETYVMIVHDITGSSTIKHILYGVDNSNELNPSKIRLFTEKVDAINKVSGHVLDAMDIIKDDGALRKQINMSNMTAEQKKEALRRADALQSDRVAFLTATIVLTAATATMVGPSAIAFGLFFGAITTSSDFFWQARMGNILGQNVAYPCRWIIDPSGYVYEAVPSNRLEGVTATAYWIAPDFIDDNGIGDDSKAVKWDASEYEQLNPLITDYEGKYAWDVPEGLWQVVFEKEGYETIKTDWLPVPPPQTEVNVGMISYNAPEIEKAEWDGKNLTVAFNRPIMADTINNITLKDSAGHSIDYSVKCESENYNETEISKVFVFVTDKEPCLLEVNSNIKSYADIGMSSASLNVTYPKNYAFYDNTSKTVSIISESDHANACVYIAAYRNGKLASVKSQIKDISAGTTNIVFNDFDVLSTDTVKVFVWKKELSLTPIF